MFSAVEEENTADLLDDIDLDMDFDIEEDDEEWDGSGIYSNMCPIKQ